MKLDGAKPFFESSGDMEEQFFSVEDQGMIFDILRNKMYSNPILAICREIACNARDAHREVGKPDEPIHIQLPVGLQPEYRIKDFGPGISTDRMLNVFIKYTASTKRQDNMQTGGFGLGAKTPFSYSDQFHITTVVDGIKYSYTCGIDETKVGKLVLLGKEPSEEPNSTEIAVPVKPQDYNSFRQYTEQACRRWTVRPSITGSNIVWSEHKKLLEGANWVMEESDGGYYGGQHPKLVIDGIEYPLELEALRKYADAKLIASIKGDLVMYFGVGELSLSANREQVYLDKPTQDKIGTRLEEIQKEIKIRVETKIETFLNYWDANLYYRKEMNAYFNNIDFLLPLSWHGHQLTNRQGSVNIGCNVYYFERGKYSRKYGPQPDKLSRSIMQVLTFENDYELYLNDLSIKEPTIKHVKKAFDDNPALKRIQVICPTDTVTEDSLNTKFHLDLMLPKRLSSITKAKGRAYTPSASRLFIFKFDPVPGDFRQVSYDAMEEDPHPTKVLCLLHRRDNDRIPILINQPTQPFDLFRALLEKNSDVSFYGVDQNTDKDRLEEEFSDFTKADDFMDTEVFNNKAINFLEIKFAQDKDDYRNHHMIEILDQIEPLILDKQSLFLTRLFLLQKLAKLKDTNKALLFIYEQVKGEITDVALGDFATDNPEWDIGKIDNQYESRYPLLTAYDIYTKAYARIEDIAHYVNLIDKELAGV
jgi:hypothetical protein